MRRLSMRIRGGITPDARVIKKNFCCVCGLKLKNITINLCLAKNCYYICSRKCEEEYHIIKRGLLFADIS